MKCKIRVLRRIYSAPREWDKPQYFRFTRRWWPMVNFANNFTFTENLAEAHVFTTDDDKVLAKLINFFAHDPSMKARSYQLMHDIEAVDYDDEAVGWMDRIWSSMESEAR